MLGISKIIAKLENNPNMIGTHLKQNYNVHHLLRGHSILFVYTIVSANETPILQILITFIYFHGLPLCIVADSVIELQNSVVSEFERLYKMKFYYTTSKNSNNKDPVDRLLTLT